MIPTPTKMIHHNDFIIQNTSYLPHARTIICWLIIHEYPKYHNIISNKWLSKYLNITWNCIPSRKQNEHAYTLSKKTYTAVRIGGNFEACISFGHAIPSAKVLSPISTQKVIFEPLNCKNIELNTNEGKEILLVWVAMNLENDRLKIWMQISEEYHLAFNQVYHDSEQEYDHHFPAIGINFIVSLKFINYLYTLFEKANKS